MARKTYAGRYAQAIFEIALEAKELDRWQSDLTRLASVIDEPAVKAFLESPGIHLNDKLKLLSERLEGVNPLCLNLVLLLVTKGKLGIISDIAEDYRKRLNSYRGIEEAEVTTAVPLDEKDKIKLAKHLGAMVGKKVVIKSEVDPGLIGGLVVKIDSKLLDGSTRGKLLALRKKLVGVGR